MKKLIKGIHRFQQGYHAEHREAFQILERGHAPKILIITCSDSRVSPSMITGSAPGELFVIRNAGNMMPLHEEAKNHFSGEAATLQYAVEVLNVEDIIVCGHTDCGAVKALMQPSEALLDLDLVHRWVDQAGHLREIVAESFDHLTGRDRHIAAIEQNVLIQVSGIQTYPFIFKRIQEGRLSLHGWVYHIGSGEVTTYDSHADGFVSVHQAYRFDGTGPLSPLELASWPE